MLHGAPGFFSPRPFPPVNSAAESPDQVSYYDISPLKETLARLVDFDRINSTADTLHRLATNVRTGAPAYFDNLGQKITSAHVMASSSLPPGFPPTEIDGEYYWDGGVVSNSPMQFVIDNRRRYSALVFQVDLWDASGEAPLDIPSANLRAMEIHSASRINVSLEQYKKMQKFRHALRRFLDQLPEQCQNDPEVRFLVRTSAGESRDHRAIEISGEQIRNCREDVRVLAAAMEEHWQAGYEDTRVALVEPGVLELPHVSEAARIFDVHHGWAA